MNSFEIELAGIHFVQDVPASAESQMRGEGFEKCAVKGVWAKWLGESDFVRVSFEMVNEQSLPKLPWALVPIGACNETDTVLLQRVARVPSADGT
jgi:hypothetical protein